MRPSLHIAELNQLPEPVVEFVTIAELENEMKRKKHVNALSIYLC